MKLINARKETLIKPVVGNTVRLCFNHFDGRTYESSIRMAKVVKVNKVTFHAETHDGKIYRVRFDDPDFKGVLK